MRKVFNKLLAHTMQSALKGNETDVFNIKATIAAQTNKKKAFCKKNNGTNNRQKVGE